MPKRYLIHCDFCSKRVIVKDTTGLVGMIEIPQASVPGGIHYMEGKKIKEKDSLPRRKLLKCPGCGRGLVLRKDTVALPETEEEKKNEEEDFGPGRKASALGREVPIDPAGGTPP